MVRELGVLQAVHVPSGLATSHCHALMEIGEAAGLTAGRLAEMLRLDKSTTSRIVAELVRRGWVRAGRDRSDGRRIALALTASGRRRVADVHRTANERVSKALEPLDQADRILVREGLGVYARALERSRRRAGLSLRQITRRDSPAVAAIIRTVMPEYGAVGPGYAIDDPEVDDMFHAYPRPRSGYFVVTDGTTIFGGGGYGPLAHGDEHTCELRKMYFLKTVRGLGLGQALLTRAIESARADGYRLMYLETLRNMTDAARLYAGNGFKSVSAPMGATGHFAWYMREL